MSKIMGSIIQSQEKIIVLIHGMWSRPHVWNNFRGFFEARGYKVVIPTLRYHDREPGMEPDGALGTASLRDYMQDLETEIRALPAKPFVIGHSMGGLLTQMLGAKNLLSGAALLASVQCAPILPITWSGTRLFLRALATPFWRRPQLPAYGPMRRDVLNGLDEEEARKTYEALVPDSGRALSEIAFWFLSRNPASFIRPEDMTCPLLFVAGDRDGITPLRIIRRNARYYGDKAQFEILPGRSHWLPSEPGWEDIAARCARFFECEVSLATRPNLDFPAPAAGAFQPI